MLVMRSSDNIKGLLDLIEYLPINITMVEVGCYAGESTLIFLESGKISNLYAVDIWEDELGYFAKINNGHNFSLVEKNFDEKVKNYNVQKYKMDLNRAKSFIPKVDFVYIDANHDYEYVLSDIKNSKGLIKDGGYLGGHDYNWQTPGVIKAVNEVFQGQVLTFSDTSWLVKL